MAKPLPNTDPGKQRTEASCVNPTYVTAEQRYNEDVREFYEVLSGCVRDCGGNEKLAARMNKKPSYGSKISAALSHGDDMKFHAEMMAGFFDVPAALDRLRRYLEARAERQRLIPEAEINAACALVLAEIKDEEEREMFVRRVARKLGARPEDIKL